MIELERERKKKNAKKRKVRNRIVTSTPRSQQQQKWWIKIYIRWMNEWMNERRERRERNSWIKNEEIKLKRNETEIRKIYDDESLYHLKLHAHNLV